MAHFIPKKVGGKKITIIYKSRILKKERKNYAWNFAALFKETLF